MESPSGGQGLGGDPYYTPGNLGISRATAQTLFSLLSPPNSKTPLWLEVTSSRSPP